MPTVTIDAPELLPSLLADLADRPDAVVDVVDERTVRVDLVGSYAADAMRLALYLRLRAWEAAQRAQGVEVSVEVE
jgi:hypothetical protein